MSNDDDTKPPRRERDTVWGDDERIAIGAERRRATRSGGVQAIPRSELLETEEITSPYELLERDPTPSELDYIRRSSRNRTDPATVEDIVKLAEVITKERVRHKSGQNELEDKLVKLLDRPPDEALLKLRCDLEKIEVAIQANRDTTIDHQRSMKLIGWVGATLATILLGSVGFIIDRVWARAEHEGETTIRIDHLERSLEQIHQDLRDDRSLRRFTPPKDPP